MRETWVIVTTDVNEMIGMVAKGLDEGWVSSCYRVKDEDKHLIRTDNTHIPRELYDQEEV